MLRPDCGGLVSIHRSACMPIAIIVSRHRKDGSLFALPSADVTVRTRFEVRDHG
jgi:hypothetical protein